LVGCGERSREASEGAEESEAGMMFHDGAFRELDARAGGWFPVAGMQTERAGRGKAERAATTTAVLTFE
jgi:hypothetical protein